uniref:Coat protein n=1 Tax=Conidiobolus adiaeretus totivirus 2 TaxID=2980974 RepID=A0A977R5G7_9VIRU|nr:coat protein [Conidiobolus adiaeretus totivirus 2]
MLTKFIQDIVNVDLSRRYGTGRADGRFNFVNNTQVVVRKEEIQYKTELVVSGGFQFAGRRIRVVEQTSATNYSGINKKFIDENGVYDPLVAVNEFARAASDRRLVKEDTNAILARQTFQDSHEAFILNMLISWLKADLYREGQNTDDVLKVKTSPYMDSHVICPLDQEAEEHTYEVPMGVPVPAELIEGAAWIRRSNNNYWSRPYVIHYTCGRKGKEEFYLAHVQGRRRNSALNFDIDIQGIETRDLLLDPANGVDYEYTNYNAIPWTDPETLWGWITDYVHVNRLQEQFAKAFELLGAIAAQPQWTSLEACHWQDAQMVVVIPSFCPTRARIRMNLEGLPYMPNVDTMTFLSDEASPPSKYITASAIANYYMWYGAYTLLHNQARSRDDWRSVFDSNVDELGVLTTSVMRSGCISAITGKEYATNFDDNCAMYIDFTPMFDRTHLGPLKRLDNTFDEYFEITSMFAPVSGALVLGTLVGLYDSTCHLAGFKMFTGRGALGTIYTMEESLFLANLYRMFGHEAIFRDLVSKTEFVAWAPVHDCIVDPSVIEFSALQPRSLMLVDTQRREGRSDSLLPPAALLDGKPFTVTVVKPTIRPRQTYKVARVVKPVPQLPRAVKPVKFIIKAPMTYDPVKFKARLISDPSFKRPDFQNLTTEIPPTKPEGPTIVATDTAEDATDQERLPHVGNVHSEE